MGLVSVGIVVVVAVAVGGLIASIVWGESDDAAPLAAASPTSTPEPPNLTPSPAPTTAPLAIPPVVATATPKAAPTPTAVPVPGRTIGPPVVPTSVPSVESAGSTSGPRKGPLVFEAKLDGTPDEWDNLGFLGDPEASEARFRQGAIEMAVLRQDGNLTVSRNSDARLRYVGDVDISVSPGSDVTFWWTLRQGLSSEGQIILQLNTLDESSQQAVLKLVQFFPCPPDSDTCVQQPPDQLTGGTIIEGVQTGRKVTLTALVDEARYQVYVDGVKSIHLDFAEVVGQPIPLDFHVFGRVGLVSLLGARVYELPAGEQPAAAAATPTTTPAERVPADAVPFRGHWYLVVPPTTGWEQAKRHAESLGGHLVTIGDEAENIFVADLAGAQGLDTIRIGLTDQASEGRFVWATGEALSYTNWPPGQPDNARYGATDEDYVELITRSDDIFQRLQWNDVPDFTVAYVVEFEGLPTPTPTPKPIPRWDVHCGGIDDDRKDATALHITFRPQRVSTDSAVYRYVHFTLALV